MKIAGSGYCWSSVGSLPFVISTKAGAEPNVSISVRGNHVMSWSHFCHVKKYFKYCQNVSYLNKWKLDDIV